MILLKNWPKAHRILVYICFSALAASLIFLSVSFMQSPGSVIGWDVNYMQHTSETEIDIFDTGGFRFVVPADLYLTYTFFQGSPVRPQPFTAVVFVAALIFCSTLLLTLITTLPRFWFFVTTGLFIVFMVSLRLEVLYLFEVHGRTIALIIMSVILGTAFYFVILRPETTLVTRLVVFTVLALTLTVVVYLFAGVSYPAFHMAVTGYWPALILTVLFTLMVAHEIPAAFVYLTGQAGTGRRNALHFTLLTLLYILYLFLLYFDEVGILSLNLPKVSVYLLMLISTALGFWGFRQREHLYETILSFRPAGALFYLALAIMAIFTTGFLLYAYNDAALKVIREIILFSHLGYGIIFFTYVVSNFMAMMARNLPAHKVLYKPTRMPYFTFRLAGLIATLAFVFYMNWKEYVYHAMGGYYNNLGDLHQLLDKPAMAEVFYRQVRSYAFQNNRANYQLAITESQRYNREQAAQLYELANAKRPTPYSVINHANLYARTGSWFEAIRLYRNGFDRFHDPHIALNLGYAYAQVHKTDSALYFLEQARKAKGVKALAEGNFLALTGQEFIPLKVDSVAALMSPSAELKANALALAIQRKQSIRINADESLNYPSLDVPSATLLYNYLIAHLGRHDSTFLNKVLQLASDSVNADYSEALKAALAYAYYYQLQPAKALDLLSEISFTSQSYESRYQYLMGLWTLQQSAPEQAIHHFKRASETGYREADQYLVVAQAEARHHEEARESARLLIHHPDTTVRQIGRQLLHVLTANAAHLTNDEDRYLFCRYSLSLSDNVLFEQVLRQFADTNYKALSLMEWSERQLRIGNLESAAAYTNRLTEIPVTDKTISEKIRRHQLLLLALSHNIPQLQEKLTSDLPFYGFDKQQLNLYRALLAEHAGDTTRATSLFKSLVRGNPFFEEGVLEAVRYFTSRGTDDLVIYNMLADAIHRNRYSYRLLIAYARKAEELGFETYAAGARERANLIRKSM